MTDFTSNVFLSLAVAALALSFTFGLREVVQREDQTTGGRLPLINLTFNLIIVGLLIPYIVVPAIFLFFNPQHWPFAFAYGGGSILGWVTSQWCERQVQENLRRDLGDLGLFQD